ncbi:hypothetical protein GE09DRAFT_1087536 [Coniochaeta sp. 2T2.1]|nr:hypothetical protein GE09DRAFT_1087536 [Coniochaeta sp. 2T2.1]
MAPEQVNELLSSQKSSDGLQIALHPLPLLEISDHITRSFQRRHKGAIIGALLGQQNGRQITIEYSFTIGATKSKDGKYHTDPESFIARLDQMRDVHKDPPLDIVGWYTLVPKTGPSSDHLPIHNEILERYNESAILLGFHIEDILADPKPGNPLPITIYESNYEAEDVAGKDAQCQGQGEDQQMKDSDTKMVLRFRELPYSTETGEAEMIAMQYIREGAAHATREGGGGGSAKTAAGKNTKGKKPESGAAAPVDQDANLNKDELEQISALQTKANAIKMMRDRIGLLIAYLERLDPAYISGTSHPITEPADGSGEYLPPSQTILRQIQALVTNIELVTPARQDELEKEMLRETNDVKLVGLLKDVLASVSDMRDVGRKFAIVEGGRTANKRGQAGITLGGGDRQASSLVGDLHTH